HPRTVWMHRARRDRRGSRVGATREHAAGDGAPTAKSLVASRPLAPRASRIETTSRRAVRRIRNASSDPVDNRTMRRLRFRTRACASSVQRDVRIETQRGCPYVERRLLTIAFMTVLDPEYEFSSTFLSPLCLSKQLPLREGPTDLDYVGSRVEIQA